MPYIYSTLTNDQLYTVYKKTVNDLQIPEHSVLVKGGTGLANDRLITPMGVRTEVSDADLAALEKNPVFQQHKWNGFIVVENKKEDPEKVASSMTGQDESSPRTPAHYKTKRTKQEDVVVTTNTKE